MTNKIKIYYCKVCESRDKHFGGTREMVRKHLREEHLIRGKLKINGVIEESQLTANTLSEVLE